MQNVLRKKWGRALINRAAALFGSWTAARLAAGLKPPPNVASRWPRANKAAIVAEIRRRKRTGESLQTTKIEREKGGHPLMTRARTLFGGWSAAILAAGVDPPAGLTSPWIRANQAEILSEIRRRKRAREQLHASRIEREKWGSPLVGRARELFGSWNAALITAGIDLPAGAYLKSPWPEADKEQILSEIRRRKRAGEQLRYGQIQREQWGKPLLRRGGALFRSWSAALRAAGIEPVKENSPWPKADRAAIVAEVKRRQRSGEPLRYAQVQRQKWGKPLLRRAKLLFSSWNDALAAAGFNDRQD